jgi:hypothetical protein
VRARLGPALAGLLVVVVLMLASASSPGAGHGRVALVGADDELAHAVEVGLTPWGVALVRGAAGLRDATPATFAAARALAHDEHLDAIVWLAIPGGGSTVVCMYDADNDRVLTRTLGASAPFDAARAAAAALTIKAMLRSSVVAPPEERGPPSPSEVVAAPPPGSTTVAPPSSRPASTAPSAVAPKLDRLPGSPGVASTAPSAGGGTLDLEGGAGVRLLTTGTADARVSAGAAWSPRGWAGFGLGVAGSLGTGATVQSQVVDARLMERALGLSLRRRFALSTAFALVATVAAGVEWTTVNGTAGSGRSALARDRVDPCIDGTLRIAWRVGGVLSLGLSADLTYILRSQRYTADGVTVAQLAVWQPGASLWLGASTF